MRVYHGSAEIIKYPRIMEPTRTLDYGRGFYTTTSYGQAEQWVRRRMKPSCLVGYVNIYEINDNVRDGAYALWFEEPTEEWVDFVMKNRTLKDFEHNYDYCIWPCGK